MQIERLTGTDKRKLNDLKSPYRNSMATCLTMIGILSLLIAGVFFIKIYEGSFFFKKLQIHWTFPAVFTTISYLWYKAKVRTINVDLKFGTKRITEFVVESKGSGKYGAYSTGNYIASGSSNNFYLEFGDTKYYCSKGEFESFKIGDKVNAAISQKSKIILSIEMSLPNNPEIKHKRQ